MIFNDTYDGTNYLSAAEVLELEYKGGGDETMVAWAVIQRLSSEASYTHNTPMVDQRLSSEYVDGRGKSWVASSKAKLAGLTMIRLRYGHEDCEIIVPTFTDGARREGTKNACVSLSTSFCGRKFGKVTPLAFNASTIQHLRRLRGCE